MSKIEVNTVEPQCGTTLTLGACGDTVALGSGAAQTGFGRTGTVDWVTTIKTNSDSPITAESGKGYFLNTTAAVITINLPTSPAAGDIVSIKDYARTFATYAVTVGRGGSNMDGNAADTTLSSDGTSATFIYMDGTKGWTLINDDATTATGAAFIVATGGAAPTAGTIVCTNYKVHTFTGPGTFCVSAIGNPAGSTTVDYLVIAGGGGGGASNGGGGGGGAGGYRESDGTASGCYTVSPRGAGPCTSALPVSVQGYPISIGAAGAKSCVGGGDGGNGGNSIFSTKTSTGGGGGGGTNDDPGPTGSTGGSGGGSGRGGPAGAAGNTPSTTPAQGFAGGKGYNPDNLGGGGGGATAVGTAADQTPGGQAGSGGAGGTSSINATPTARGGGGGGDNENGNQSPTCNGGAGGGGPGGNGAGQSGTDATINTGGGGGGGDFTPGCGTGGSGGSGIVYIRYKFQ